MFLISTEVWRVLVSFLFVIAFVLFGKKLVIFRFSLLEFALNTAIYHIICPVLDSNVLALLTAVLVTATGSMGTS